MNIYNTFSSVVQQLSDARIILFSIMVAFMHILANNITEYFLVTKTYIFIWSLSGISFILKMFQGSLPMLTKGPIALFYGGDSIIEDLSERSPGRGVPILLICSSVFQIFLYILKQSKSRKLIMYVHNLNKSLVENVLNMYGIITNIIITTITAAFGLFHHWSIEKNEKQEKQQMWSQGNSYSCTLSSSALQLFHL